MTPKRPRPVLAIAADLPLGRLLTSFRNKDRRAIPWIFSLFHALESQEDFDIHWICLLYTSEQSHFFKPKKGGWLRRKKERKLVAVPWERRKNGMPESRAASSNSSRHQSAQEW